MTAAIVDLLCHDDSGPDDAALVVHVLSAAADSCPIEELPGRLSAIHAACESGSYGYELQGQALLALRRRAPTRFSELLETLRNGSFVCGAGQDTSMIKLVGWLAHEGRIAELESLIGDAAHGAFGSTRLQMEQAALFASHVEAAGSPGRALQFLEGICSSGALAANPDYAGFLAALLLKGHAWPGGDSTIAAQDVATLLFTPAYEDAVAIQLLAGYSEQAPAGIEPEPWHALWEQALTIAHAKRFVVGGVQY